MAGYIEGVDRQQATLFPERLDALVAGDALVRVIDGFVEQLDVGGRRLHSREAGRDRAAGVSAGRSLAAFSLRLHERGAVESGAGAGVLDEPGAGLATPPAAARLQDAHGMLAPISAKTTATRSVGPARRSFASP
jgi:hypothetical protein